MLQGRGRISAAMMIVGALLLVLALVSGGFSAVFTPRAGSIDDMNSLGVHSGGLYRPFAEAEFGYATFSGLYLTDENDNIEVWVMWGFSEDCVTCFFQKADGRDIDGDGKFDENDAPQDALEVSYILRAAEPEFAKHSEWAVKQSAADTAGYYGVEQERMRVLFADYALEASRSDRIVMRAALAAGLLLLIAGAALLVYDRRNGKASTEEELMLDLLFIGDEEDPPFCGDDEEEFDIADEELDSEALMAAENDEDDGDDEN